MRLCVPQVCRLRAPTVKPRRRYASASASRSRTVWATWCRPRGIVPPWASLIDRRERRRRQDLARQRLYDRAVALALGAFADPLGIAHERVPFLLALGQRFPGQHVMQVVVGFADQRGPEAGLADAVPLPDAERGGLEALEQCRHAARHATVDAQFVDHGAVRWLVVSGSAAARGGAIYTNRGPSTTGSVARMERSEIRERRCPSRRAAESTFPHCALMSPVKARRRNSASSRQTLSVRSLGTLIGQR